MTFALNSGVYGIGLFPDFYTAGIAKKQKAILRNRNNSFVAGVDFLAGSQLGFSPGVEKATFTNSKSTRIEDENQLRLMWLPL